MKSLFRFLAFAGALVGLFVFGFAWRDVRALRLPPAHAVNGLLGATILSQTQASPVQIFRQAYAKIRGSYYKPVNEKELRYAGLQGLLASLGDPHTLFLEPEQAREFAIDTTGNFVGVGARLTPDPLGAKVAVVFEDGPAWKAGIRENDLITGVDGKSMTGKPVDDIVKLIRGTEGTIVRLTYLRPGEKPVTVPIKRSQIVAPSVESRVVPGHDIGHLTIIGFSEPTAEQFDNALDKLEKAGIQGLVIDVRNNPGGLLETTTELLSRFAEDKVVVKMRMRDGREAVEKTFYGYQRKFRYPIVVLINEESASASEIFAGALRDYKIATLVGEHTYGKASVQNLFPFVDGSSAKVTIARYFLPSGADISRKVDPDGVYVSGGLMPDVEAKLEPGTIFQAGDPKSDAQLRKAIEIIQSKR